MITSLVVAASTNNVIGKDNKLLWSLPNDMKFFKNTTWGMPVVMGRKTFESLGKALNGRTNIVITRQADFAAEGVKVVGSMDDAMVAAADADAKEIYVIGGGEIYKQALLIAHRVYITRVHTVVDGDTFFPELPTIDWKLLSRLDFKADAKHAYDYSFEVWERIPQ
ncbi:MAG: dihydrofolate reductase [Chitinophagaceae bacterium]|nr:dihydrofolate reductase [Chitinophagaceae bacterium]